MIFSRRSLTSFDAAGLDDWRRRERHGVFKAFLSWIDEDASSSEHGELRKERRAGSLKAMLGHLFPILGSYLANPANPSYLLGHSYGPIFERELRICSPAHFNTYFGLHVRSTEIPTSVVKEFIASLSIADDADVNEIASVLLEYKVAGRLVRFLQKLSLYASDIQPDGATRLIYAIARIAPELDWNTRYEFLTEARAALLTLLDHLLDSQDIEIAQEQLETVVHDCESLAFAAAVVQSSDPSGESRKAPQGVEFMRLVEILRQRIRTELVEPARDVFWEYPESHGVILGAWRSDTALNDRAGLDDYVSSLLDQDPTTTLRILADFVWTSIPSGEPSQLGFEDLESRYDVDCLYQTVRQLNVDDIKDLFLKYAAEQFIVQYHHRREQENPPKSA